MPYFQSALLLVLFSLFTGCGQTGPLVLPEDAAQQQTSPGN